ncbi:segregation/condensation protein A [Bacillus lacus]|uniref:Segregation and condensation protein A n=1 Tax=Metabacillus lacus TaxID=1983721 RepID=A0A7X2IWF3_9BACI|nr:segregation/condensation protein A [Metabacillus lacus]
MKYEVKLDAFEGPLDLLLHLINRLEIDIYDIPVSEITDQYMSYIHTMQVLQLDVASEYLVMAATLLSIKSGMLLPKQEEELLEDFEYAEEEDPREELMRKLIEYRKYKDAAKDLLALEEESSLSYTRPPLDSSKFAEIPAAEQPLNVTLYDMLGAFQKVLRRKKLQKPLQTRITRQEIPIEKRMEEIIRDLQTLKGRCQFSDLFPQDNKEYLVVSFLAILELMKNNTIKIEQEDNFSDIYIVGRDLVDGVED